MGEDADDGRPRTPAHWTFRTGYGGWRSQWEDLTGLSDAEVGRRQFRRAHGRDPDLEQPRTFNEKIQWYKLNYRRPEMPRMADKLRVRDHVAALGLGHLLNDLYAVYDRADAVDFDALPSAFALKATHGCGWNILCADQRLLDRERARRLMHQWLQRNYFDRGREWSYRDIPPRIIAERFLEDPSRGELIDYKFYCFDGVPTVLFVCAGRYRAGGVRYDAFDMDWRPIPVFKGKPAARLGLPPPAGFAEMVDAAARLSQGWPFLRVDLYQVGARVLFGELTFYPDNGAIPFAPDHYNQWFGDRFRLPAEPVLA